MIRVIVIDDEKDMVEMVSEYLGEKGISVVGRGYDGKDAYYLYKKLRPDLVILDIRMPVYDGYYAIKKIKKEDPHAKILVVTGYANNFGLKNEVIDVIQKPYEVKKLIEKIKMLMSKN